MRVCKNGHIVLAKVDITRPDGYHHCPECRRESNKRRNRRAYLKRSRGNPEYHAFMKKQRETMNGTYQQPPEGDYPCPRCGHQIPDNNTPGMFMGALSRKDNQTEVCSACGAEEAMIQFAGGKLDDEPWPVKPIISR